MDLVFEGGGVLGISFLGAYKALRDSNFDIVRCAGTSAGSVIASLIMAGYGCDELIEVLENTDLKQFLKKTKLSSTFIIGKGLSLLFNKGIYNGQCVEIWIENLLNKKGIHTFKDIMIDNVSPLKIIAADITKRKLLILPDDLDQYGIGPQHFSIAKAVQMSCTIPFFYTPVKQKDSYIVDGGLLSTFPVWIFDIEEKPVRPTFGLKIKDKCSFSSNGKHNIFSYIVDLINASLNRDEMSYVRDKDSVRTIILQNDHQIKSTDFKLTRDDIKYLYQVGYESVIKFLKTWNYSDYIKRFML